MLHNFNYFEIVEHRSDSTANKRLYKKESQEVNYKTTAEGQSQELIPAKHGFLNAESAFDRFDQQRVQGTQEIDKQYRRWSLSTSFQDKDQRPTTKGAIQIDCSTKE